MLSIWVLRVHDRGDVYEKAGYVYPIVYTFGLTCGYLPLVESMQ